MDESTWFSRFYDRKDLGMNDRGINKLYGLGPLIIEDFPLCKFIFEFHNDLVNYGFSESEYIHIFEDGKIVNDGIWLKVTLSKKQSEQKTDVNYVFDAVCRNESNNIELKEMAEFDHVHNAKTFIDFPIGLFYMCKKLIINVIWKSSQSDSKKISAAEAIKAEKEKLRKKSLIREYELENVDCKSSADNPAELDSGDKTIVESTEKSISEPEQIKNLSDPEGRECLKSRVERLNWKPQVAFVDAIRQWTIDTFQFFIENLYSWPTEKETPIEGYDPYWACYRIERYPVKSEDDWILNAVAYKGQDADVEMKIYLEKGPKEKIINFMKNDLVDNVRTSLSFMQDACYSLNNNSPENHP